MSARVIVEAAAAGVQRLVLNRPEKRNPLDGETRDALKQALELAAADMNVRAVIITGAGGNFCAGGDVATMGQSDEHSGSARMAANHALVRTLYRFEKPLIAQIEGFAMGAGAGVALLCDAIVMGDHARMGFPFLKLSLVPDYGIVHTLTARVGAARARQMLLRAQTLTSSEALASGLADEAVAEAHLPARALDLAQEMASQPRAAFGLVKRMLAAEPQSLDAALELERTAQTLAFLTGDHKEGVAAFKDKRPPRFS